MFAMLGGALSSTDEPAANAAAQAGAGLAVVTDGLETIPAGDGDAARLTEDLLAGRGSGAADRWAAIARAVMAADAGDVGAAEEGGTSDAAGTAAAAAASLPGPWSLALRVGSGAAVVDPALVHLLAEAVGREAAGLGAAGCPLVRVDEPDAHLAAAAAARGEAGATDLLVGAHRALVEVASSGAATHLMLALTGGDHVAIGADALAGLGYRSYLFDLIAGPDDWRIAARLPGDRGVVCGVVAPETDAGDAPEIIVWAARYAASTGGRGIARVGLATAGSLATLPAEEAAAKMRALAEGARIAALPAEAMAAELDPRALDMRSAAVGAWYRDPRFSRRAASRGLRDASPDPDR